MLSDVHGCDSTCMLQHLALIWLARKAVTVLLRNDWGEGGREGGGMCQCIRRDNVVCCCRTFFKGIMTSV